MGRPRHWIKLWVSWLDSKAHLELSEGAFGLGPLLLLLASWDGEYESGGWLLNEAGAPMSAEALARATHRTSVARLNSQIAELVACNTLTVRDDGAVGFANYGHWQESKSAKRMRTVRAQCTDLCAPSDAQTEDVRRQNASHTPVAPKGAKRDSAPKPKPADPLDEPAARILSKLNELRSEGVPGSRLSDTRWILRLLRARPDAEAEALQVLEHSAAEARASGDWQWVNASTPFRLEHFEGRLARAQAAAVKRPPPRGGGGSSLPSAAEIRAREAAEDAERGWT